MAGTKLVRMLTRSSKARYVINSRQADFDERIHKKQSEKNPKHSKESHHITI